MNLLIIGVASKYSPPSFSMYLAMFSAIYKLMPATSMIYREEGILDTFPNFSSCSPSEVKILIEIANWM